MTDTDNTKNKPNDDGPHVPRSAYLLARMMTSKRLIAAIGVYVGIGLILLNKYSLANYPIHVLIQQHGLTVLGAFVVLVSTIVMMSDAFKRLLLRERSFSDVDREMSDSRLQSLQNRQMHQILREVRHLRESQTPIDADQVIAMVRESMQNEARSSEQTFASFRSFFAEIVRVLERKADIADQKASILLDRGIAYTKFGIGFFVVSIVAWQLLAGLKGFQTQFIYGIVSCSILFLFIEFLSAWFLKQYRHFIDTSTYLIQVKSLFDKFMLTYFAIKEFPSGADLQANGDPLMALLAQDIKWPDGFLFGDKDASFARDSVDAVNELLKGLKDFQGSSSKK